MANPTTFIMDYFCSRVYVVCMPLIWIQRL